MPELHTDFGRMLELDLLLEQLAAEAVGAEFGRYAV